MFKGYEKFNEGLTISRGGNYFGSYVGTDSTDTSKARKQAETLKKGDKLVFTPNRVTLAFDHPNTRIFLPKTDDLNLIFDHLLSEDEMKKIAKKTEHDKNFLAEVSRMMHWYRSGSMYEKLLSVIKESIPALCKKEDGEEVIVSLLNLNMKYVKKEIKREYLSKEEVSAILDYMEKEWGIREFEEPKGDDPKDKMIFTCWYVASNDHNGNIVRCIGPFSSQKEAQERIDQIDTSGSMSNEASKGLGLGVDFYEKVRLVTIDYTSYVPVKDVGNRLKKLLGEEKITEILEKKRGSMKGRKFNI